jgi:cysteine desulfurase
VLQAIGGDASDTSATIRFGIGRFTTEDEIDYTIEKFTTVVRKLRDTAPGAATRTTPTANEDHRRA